MSAQLTDKQGFSSSWAGQVLARLSLLDRYFILRLALFNRYCIIVMDGV